MNKIGIALMAMMVLSISSVMAVTPTGFNLDNSIGVTGDWEWDGGAWQQGNFQTASLEMKIRSPSATTAAFTDSAVFGTPWHLDYDSSAQVMAPVKFENKLTAITVNSPITTPATGGWTQLHFVETTTGVFSGGHLSVNGFGNIFVQSQYNLQSSGIQVLDVNIN